MENTTSFRLSDGLILFIIALILAVLGFGGYRLFLNGNVDTSKDTLHKIITTKTLDACAVLATEDGKRQCYTKGYPLLSNSEGCAVISFDEVRDVCVAYHTAIHDFKNSNALLKKMAYTYEKREVELLYRDGSTKRIVVDVADTVPMRAQGLSYRTEMREDEGMLFTFGGNPVSPFYMKDMLLPLDILFLDRDGEVINSYMGVPSCVPTPDTCPLLYPAHETAVEVLEILPQPQEVVKVTML